MYVLFFSFQILPSTFLILNHIFALYVVYPNVKSNFALRTYTMNRILKFQNFCTPCESGLHRDFWGFTKYSNV